MHRRGAPDLEVTCTRSFLNFLSIADRNAAARIVDQFFLTQLLRDACDAWPVHTERTGDLFMCKIECGSAAAVMYHQEPRAEAFLYRMIHIADSFLRDLSYVQIDKAAKSGPQIIVALQQLLKCLGIELSCCAALRYLRAIGRCV